MKTLNKIILATSLFLAINIVMPPMTAKAQSGYHALKVLMQPADTVSIDTISYAAGCDDSAMIIFKVTNLSTHILTNDTIKIILGQGVYWSTAHGPNISTNHDTLIYVFESLQHDTQIVDTYYVRGKDIKKSLHIC